MHELCRQKATNHGLVVHSDVLYADPETGLAARTQSVTGAVWISMMVANGGTSLRGLLFLIPQGFLSKLLGYHLTLREAVDRPAVLAAQPKPWLGSDMRMTDAKK